MTSLIFVFLFGPWIIDHLRLRQGKGQPIRTDGPKSHFVKAGTPTMGGLMILIAIRGVDRCCGPIRATPTSGSCSASRSASAGRVLRRLSEGDEADHHGLRRRVAAVRRGRDRASPPASRSPTSGGPQFATSLAFPLFKEMIINLGWFFVLFGAFIIVGAGNAVNLTDGLDGLAIGPVMIAAASVRRHLLSGRQRGVRRLSADPLRAGHRRAGRHMRRGDRRRAGLPLVQRAAGLDLHGRHRLARARAA